MKILVNEIPEDGVTIHGDLDPAKLKLDTDHINFSSPVHVTCMLTRADDNLFAKCDLIAMVKETCSRCLIHFDMKLTKTIDLYYELKGELSIEFDNGIKDEIILDYPIKILCRDDCKGLCQKCGKNMNEGPCKCSLKG